MHLHTGWLYTLLAWPPRPELNCSSGGGGEGGGTLPPTGQLFGGFLLAAHHPGHPEVSTITTYVLLPFRFCLDCQASSFATFNHWVMSLRPWLGCQASSFTSFNHCYMSLRSWLDCQVSSFAGFIHYTHRNPLALG